MQDFLLQSRDILRACLPFSELPVPFHLYLIRIHGQLKRPPSGQLMNLTPLANLN